MGNPPFVGYSLQSKAQKDDILSVYVDEKGKPYKTAGKIDYVSGWYFKAAQLMQGTDIRTAFCVHQLYYPGGTGGGSLETAL